MAWVAAAVGATIAGVGLVQGRNNTRRQRNLIQDAYARGKARLDVRQTDVRQQEGEGLGQRGLTGAGDVQMGGAVSPGGSLSVTGAHTLGGQQQADLQREQGLEQNDLLAQKDAGVSDVEAAGTNNAIGSISQGISAGLGLKGAMGLGAGGAPTSTDIGVGGPNAAGASPIASAYSGGAFGVHPTDPLGHPASAFYSGSGSANPGTTNDHFNVTG